MELESGFYTEVQLAQLLNVSIGALRNRRAAGDKPKYMKIGRSVRYSHKAVEEFIREQENSARKK